MNRRRRTWPASRWGLLCAAAVLLLAQSTRAELQFDVFVGYGSGGAVGDGIVREGSWFPVACEIFNDGPSFNAIFEFSSRQTGSGQARRMRIELPSNTRKRFSFPVFSGASRYASWDARLYDDRRRLQAERTDLRCRDVTWETTVLGGLARAVAGMPTLPGTKSNRPELQPQVARLAPEQFPDNPIGLEGLHALYLNSERALALSAAQAAALRTWVEGGGHLILVPEQAQDISSTPWLAGLMPVELGSLTTNRSTGAFQAWLRTGAALRTETATSPAGIARPTQTRPGNPSTPQENPYLTQATDGAFELVDLPLYQGNLIAGDVWLALEGAPAVVDARRGRGHVTVLLFNPEREPFKSWKNRPWFWARLLQLPGDLFTQSTTGAYGGWSLDGVFGAMIDTRQVRKLPIEWLLVLLVVYLLVIGPIDRWWLKKINRQMLTWITFPLYVLLFSLLIYYIGYRLRAGDTEWNELHVVDVLPGRELADLRGRSFAALYSSVNARYRLASDLPFAALRGEYLGPAGGGQEGGRVEADLVANAFQAEVTVPVWTSLLYVHDWVQSASPPFRARATRSDRRWQLEVQNLLDHALANLQVAVEGRLLDLGALRPGEIRTWTLDPASGQMLDQFVRLTAQRFQSAVNARRQTFGRENRSRLDPEPGNALAASFVSLAGAQQGLQRSFVYPSGMDLTPLVARGDLVLFAWDPERSPLTRSLLQTSTPRQSQYTLYRLAVPADTGQGH